MIVALIITVFFAAITALCSWQSGKEKGMAMPVAGLAAVIFGILGGISFVVFLILWLIRVL